MPPDQPPTQCSVLSAQSRDGYLPAVRMITEADTAEQARVLAMDAERDGRLIHVCGWCISPEVKRAVAGFANVSHGVCAVCAAGQLALLAEDNGTERSAA